MRFTNAWEKPGTNPDIQLPTYLQANDAWLTLWKAQLEWMSRTTFNNPSPQDEPKRGDDRKDTEIESG
jgi:hypothetical protein